jgi:hypothetical protein
VDNSALLSNEEWGPGMEFPPLPTTGPCPSCGAPIEEHNAEHVGCLGLARIRELKEEAERWQWEAADAVNKALNAEAKENALREAVSEWLNWAEGRKTGIAPNGTSWIGYFADKFKEALKP